MRVAVARENAGDAPEADSPATAFQLFLYNHGGYKCRHTEDMTCSHTQHKTCMAETIASQALEMEMGQRTHLLPAELA